MDEELDQIRYAQGRLARSEYYLALSKLLECSADRDETLKLRHYVHQVQIIEKSIRSEIEVRKDALRRLSRIAERSTASYSKQEPRQAPIPAEYPQSLLAVAAAEPEVPLFVYFEALWHKHNLSEALPYECPAGKLTLIIRQPANGDGKPK